MRDAEGKAVMKPFWEVTSETRCLPGRHLLVPG
jgi:hypothetical protein